MGSDARKDADRIFIRDLSLEMSIGIHPFEKAATQRVIITIDIDVRPHAAKASDITDVVSYQEIKEAVCRLCHARHYDLVETLCDEIAEICLAPPQSLSCHVRVEKPDIMPDCTSVGAEIWRSK